MKRLLLVTLIITALSGCESDPYRVNRLGDGGLTDLEADLLPPCTPTNGGVEICDGKDNDCDGVVDEVVNFNTSVDHCGKCNNSCRLNGAITVCELRACKFKGCAPGYYDVDLDLSQGWSTSSNGCEYTCTFTNATELCDGKDNDCNGKTDETFTLSSDVQNCGKCGNACLLANAVAKCEAGICKVQSCKTGFINKDKKDDNGCEAVCVYTGTEVCDGKDNDCNGVVDDVGGKAINHQTDPLNCGGCNIICALPNAVTSCVAGKCTFSGCKQGGWVNANGDPADGCECQYTGSEVCDGKDNDCDTKTDTDSGGKPLVQTCYTGPSGTLNKGPCKAGSQTCSSGTWGSCIGMVTPKTEHCDGLDTDCDGTPDPTTCVYPGTGRERRLDQPNVSTLGLTNSSQLTAAGSGDRLVAAWVDRRISRSDIYINRSNNGGMSWLNYDVGVATEGKNNKVEPRLIFGGGSGGSQRVYLIYQAFTDAVSSSQPGVRNIFVRRSNNAGQSWGSPSAVKSNKSIDTFEMQAVVVPGLTDKVIVCWVDIAITGALNPNIKCSMSVNNGSTFGAAIQVNNAANTASRPRIAADSKYLYVVMEDSKSGVLIDRSPIGGNNLSFSSDVPLSSGLGWEHQVMADGMGRVFVAWEETAANKLKAIALNASTNYGGSWNAKAARVDLDVVDGVSSTPVLGAWPNGRVLVAWSDTSRGQKDIYVGYSDDSGATWSNPVARVPSTTAGKYSSARPVLAVDPGSTNAYLAWQDFRNGDRADAYFNVSMDKGKTWNIPDYRVDESPLGKCQIGPPQILVAASRVAVLWLDFRIKSGGQLRTGPKGDVYSSYLQ